MPALNCQLSIASWQRRPVSQSALDSEASGGNRGHVGVHKTSLCWFGLAEP